MITVDRRLFGKENYLGETLKNLYRSDFFGSDRLAGKRKLTIFNSLADSSWIDDCLYWNRATTAPIVLPLGPFGDKADKDANQIIEITRVDLSRQTTILSRSCNSSACENAGSALEISGEYARDVNAKWVLFMEDDLDFCSDFLDSVGRYLDLINHKDQLFTDIPIPSFVPRRGAPQIFGVDNFQLIAFGCPYPQVRDYYGAGRKYWLYPVSSFYGTQCFAIRPHDAISLGRYLQRNPTNRNPNEYDLMIHEWMSVAYPGNKYFLASVPSFVEHVGRQSVCTDKEETHRNPHHGWEGIGGLNDI